jgi:hypothetical protein
MSSFGLPSASGAARRRPSWLGDNPHPQRPDFGDPAATAARCRRPRAFKPLQGLLAKPPFGLIRVTGPTDDRRLSLESYDGAGELLWCHAVRANDLRFPGRPGPRP